MADKTRNGPFPKQLIWINFDLDLAPAKRYTLYPAVGIGYTPYCGIVGSRLLLKLVGRLL
jgi:hypothetical protein